MSLIRVVSGGGSAATGTGDTPRSPAVPASVTPPRNLRRLNGRACWICMGTYLLDAGRCNPGNTAQWTLLPSHEQAQHLTLGLSCAWKPERSAGCKASAAGLGSVCDLGETPAGPSHTPVVSGQCV